MAYINFYLNIQTILLIFLILIKWNSSLLSHQRIINRYYEKFWAVELKLIIHFIGLYIKKRELGKNELECVD